MARLLVTVSGAQVRSRNILESMGRWAPERGLTVSNDKGVRMKCIVVLLLLVISNVALAEGRCPPGQYPVGGQGVGGCAPIPGGQAGGESSGPMPTGKWETRWGALAQDTDHQVGQNLAIGVAEVKKTKREARSLALSECQRMGGQKCKVILEYHNQCAALAGPVIGSVPLVDVKTVAYRSPNEEDAKVESVRRCESEGKGRSCTVIYSACSMSEFKPFR
ncbi:DUF4189 domain-containing protein [Stenotrophomonas muris]|jgi:hypothetical protein|uniref:DUF4189 domain-containing protein n=1 Tax=Stenotrophomonas muris TaxID=2963283 RepID=UPI000DA7C969|nr:DUF4189 domain-containing protein [Stenotrophomonas sp. PAMC25021]QGL85047.1 DUF4189 domain-containing protein [Stenotrophomonas maltophilia]